MRNGITPEDLRNRVHEVVEQAASGNATEKTAALEQLYWALFGVCDELDKTAAPDDDDTVMVSQGRVCRDLGQALGMEVSA